MSLFQGCWPMTVSNHFLYARAKRLCSGLLQLSSTPDTKLCSEGRAGGHGDRMPLFRRLVSRGSGRDTASTSIASVACSCPFTLSPLPSQPCSLALARPGSVLLRLTDSVPPLLVQWWCWCSLLQWCHK